MFILSSLTGEYQFLYPGSIFIFISRTNKLFVDGLVSNCEVRSPSFAFLYFKSHLLFQEEELRSSGDPKFSHLLEDLHVEITAFAPPAEAHARIAYALAEVRRFLVPVSSSSSFSFDQSNEAPLFPIIYYIYLFLPDYVTRKLSEFSFSLLPKLPKLYLSKSGVPWHQFYLGQF